MPSPIAGLLLAGLISDTLNLTSPTSTPRDAEVLRDLEKIAGVKASQFKERFFASGSLLTLKAAPQAITTDCKEYSELGQKFSVSQIEETGFDQFWPRKDELAAALQKHQQERRYLFAALMVTDVTGLCTLLLVAGGKTFLDQVNYPQAAPGVFKLDGVVSRKKQLLPYLIHCLRQMGGMRDA